MAHGLNREKLRFAIKWGLSIFFVVAAFFPCPFIIWIYILAYQDCHEIESTIHHIAARLRAKGRHYDPNHFNTFDLLKLLIPAQKLAPVVERLRHLIDGSTYLYFVIVCLLISVYFPLLAISLRALYKQSVSQSTIDAAMGTIINGASQPSRTGKRIHRERQRLVYHSMCVFISTVVHLPPLAWKVFHSKGDYLHDVTWNEVTRHGLVSPLAFSGNVILFILNMHSYQILVDRRMRLQHASFSVGSTREGTPYKKSTLGTLFLGDDDEDDISPSTSALEAQKEDTEKYDSSANSSEPINRYLMGGIKIQQCTFSKAS
ncbi:hypothetical protein PCANC_11802 [Puccinia coronata f. sp. avenae]|uniref:Uncharacterized protein n=1 Tax=Puccinia coronata f. sp. avenae TaxID=200324 RepID=A0A2N5SV84_9BASI|nr:hypothetical protein PCANC_11802 [Puccinia coronata f. sp. avenae]